MTRRLRKPTVRECDRCGRRERWDDGREGWVVDREGRAVDREDPDPAVGDPYCVHEWDITGSFVPFGE